MNFRRSVFTTLGLVAQAAALHAVLVAAGPAYAEPLPNAGQVVRITARDETLERFLAEVFRSIDVPVVLSQRMAEQASRKVNGDFAQPADMLLQELARSFQFVSYYDGAVMHLATPGEIESKTITVGTGFAPQVMAQAREMQMTDMRNTLRSSTGGVLVATGAPRFVKKVEELAKQVRAGADAPRAPGVEPVVATRQVLQDFRVFYLRYAWAQDTSVSFAGRQTLIPGVANILRSLIDQRPSGAGRWQAAPNTVPGMRNRERDYLRDREYIVMPFAGQRDNSASQVAQALLETTSMTAEASPPPDAARGGAIAPRIEADPRLNAVIVRDAPEQMVKYQRLISALDVEPQALEIEATIIDINTDRMRELGINWRYNRGANNIGFGSSADNSLRGLPNDPSGNILGGFASAILGNRNPFVLRIAALQDDRAAKIVASPQVVTLSNVEAVFDNSETFYTRVSGQYVGDLFNITAGTNLRVTPHVFKDEAGVTRIKLLAQIEDGTFDRRPGSTVDNLPTVKRSSINTQALIGEGESLLIGGMVRDEVSTQEDKVPLLGDVPLLGHLFKNTTTGSARTERLFLITPRLASSQATRDAQERAARPLTSPPAPAPSAGPAPAPSAPAPAPAPAQ